MQNCKRNIVLASNLPVLCTGLHFVTSVSGCLSSSDPVQWRFDSPHSALDPSLSSTAHPAEHIQECMGNIASWNVTGTKDLEKAVEELRTNRTAFSISHRVPSLAASCCVQWENGDVQYRLGCAAQSPPDPACPHWNICNIWQRLLVCSRGVRIFKTFKGGLKLACPPPRRVGKEGPLIITALYWLSEASGLRMCHFF